MKGDTEQASIHIYDCDKRGTSLHIIHKTWCIYSHRTSACEIIEIDG